MTSEQSNTKEKELKTLRAARRGRLGACTRKMNELKSLLGDGGNTENVVNGVEQLKGMLNEFKDAHAAVQMLLPDEIKENERVDWHDPKMETFEKFLQEVESWKRSSLDPQMLVEPHDSVSNVSKQFNKSKCSKQSKQSATSSSISSARLKIASERAALQARMSALRQKHAIEMEKNRLQAKLERMELETDIAASEAKLKVLDSFHEGSEGQSGVHGNDAMNGYLDSNASVDEFEPSPALWMNLNPPLLNLKR